MIGDNLRAWGDWGTDYNATGTSFTVVNSVLWSSAGNVALGLVAETHVGLPLASAGIVDATSGRFAATKVWASGVQR